MILEEMIMKEQVNRVLAGVGCRERKIIELRVEGNTFKSIGKVVGLSKERVRQLEKRGLLKMRWILNREPVF